MRHYNERISTNFHSEEFIPKELWNNEYGTARPFPEFTAAIQSIRDRAGCVVKITDGVRSPQSNLDLGKALGVMVYKKSYHIPRPVAVPVGYPPKLMFMCCDFTIPDMNVMQMLCLALETPYFRKGGIGFYPSEGIIHVDGRPDGPARWARVDGDYVSLMDGLKSYKGESDGN